MTLISLDRFINDKSRFIAEISYPGLKRLLVKRREYRMPSRDDSFVSVDAIVIQEVAAYTPGKGHFSRLVADIQKRGLVIVVEGVNNQAFADKLYHLGFTMTFQDRSERTFVLGIE